VRRRHRLVQAGGRVAERGVDEPALPIAGPDAPSVPDPRVLGLPMKLEVPHVAGFEVDGVLVVRTQDGDARVRTRFSLSGDDGGTLGADENRRADDPEPTMIHARMLSDAATSICDTDPSKSANRDRRSCERI